SLSVFERSNARHLTIEADALGARERTGRSRGLGETETIGKGSKQRVQHGLAPPPPTLTVAGQPLVAQRYGGRSVPGPRQSADFEGQADCGYGMRSGIARSFPGGRLSRFARIVEGFAADVPERPPREPLREEIKRHRDHQ